MLQRREFDSGFVAGAKGGAVNPDQSCTIQPSRGPTERGKSGWHNPGHDNAGSNLRSPNVR
jgi:hypothetical protein